MDSTAVTVAILTMFVFVLLMIGVIYSRIHWSFKAVMIGFTLFASCYSFVSVKAQLGWPVVEAQPPLMKYQFFGSLVREPKTIAGDPGAIYMYIGVSGSRDPRSLRVPYTRDLHKKIEEAKKKVAAGERVYFEGKSIAAALGEGDSAANGRRRTGTKNSPGPAGDSESDYQNVQTDFVPPPDTSIAK